MSKTLRVQAQESRKVHDDRVPFPSAPNSISHIVKTQAATNLQMAFTPEMYLLDSVLEPPMHFQNINSDVKQRQVPESSIYTLVHLRM